MKYQEPLLRTAPRSGVALALFAGALGLGGGCAKINRPIGRLLPVSGAEGGAVGAGGEGTCEALGRCGGDVLADGVVVGEVREREWIGTEGRVCSEPVAATPSDACHGLFLDRDGAGDFRPDIANAPVRSVSLRITGNEYRANVAQYAPRQVTFSAACRAEQAPAPDCPTFGRLLGAAVASAANIDDLRCVDAGTGGCICDYELLRITRVMGTWEAHDGRITFYEGSLAPRPPIEADYCRSGDTLELTEQSGSGLFNVPGLATLTLHPPTCSDGVVDASEQGVDCGGACEPCTGCDDGIQNGDELGVDCGGRCFNDLCACFNGDQDPWEEGVDCGGPCAQLCSCLNGIRDANEEGVDCGGECQLRYSDAVPVACP